MYIIYIIFTYKSLYCVKSDRFSGFHVLFKFPDAWDKSAHNKSLLVKWEFPINIYHLLFRGLRNTNNYRLWSKCLEYWT